MSVKKPVDAKPNRVSLGMKCGECLHFTKGPRKFEKLCSQIGQEPFSDACPEFTPDMTVLAKVSLESMKSLAHFAAQMSQPQIRLMAFTFRTLDYIKKTGLEFGETVYFSLDGHDYLAHYFRGIVFGASKDGKFLYIASSLEHLNRSNGLISLYTSSVFREKEFKQHRKQLIASNHIRMPNKQGSSKRDILSTLSMTAEQLAALRITLESKPVEYEPPSIDSAPKKLLDESGKGLSKRKKAEKYAVKTPSDVFVVNRYED